MTMIDKIVNGGIQSCSTDAQQIKSITLAPDQMGGGMSFNSDLPVEQWGKTQVLAKLNNWMNPSNEPNERVTQFINALLEQGYDHGTALIDLTREDLDELFPNQYLGYKKTILSGIESLKTTNRSSTTISNSTHCTQNVESVRGINSQHIDGPVSYTAGDTHHGPAHIGDAQFHSSSFGEFRGNLAQNNNAPQNYTDNTSHTSQDNRSIQVPSAQSSGGLLLSVGAFMAGLSQMAGESGTCSIGGRSVRYQVSGRLHKFKWVYDAKVMDLATQLQGSSKHFKSKNGALGNALNALSDQLKAHRILAD